MVPPGPHIGPTVNSDPALHRSSLVAASCFLRLRGCSWHSEPQAGQVLAVAGWGRFNGPVGDVVSLRPIEERDIDGLLRFFTEPGLAGEFQWFGFRAQDALDLRRRWEQDRLSGEESFLAVSLEDGSCAGWVNWRPAGRYGNFEIGIALFPEHRGRGIGTEAQRQLVRYLFEVTPAHRIQAGTEADNLAEQRAFEKVGFVHEGVMRGSYFRAGRWRDGVLYGVTRDDLDHTNG